MNVRIWALAAFFALVLACGGCGDTGNAPAREPVRDVPEAPAETSPADAVPPETEDHMLSTLESAVGGGRVLRLEVIGKKRADMDQWGVREVRVYDGDTPVQTIPAQEAILADGVSGAVDEGYTDCWSVEEAAAVRDMNFDGCGDLALFGWCCSNAIPHYYWLWDAETGQYRYAFCLQGAEADKETETVTSQYQYENGVYYTDRYRYDAGGNLELVQRETADYNRPIHDGEPTREVYDVIDGQLALQE